jgi:hypothetical protein
VSDMTTLGALSAGTSAGRISGREEVAAGATTAILTFTPPTNCTTTITVTATARDATAGDGAGYVRVATFKRTTGNVSQVGATTSVATHEDDAGWNLTITANTTSIQVNAVGDAANVTRWSYSAELVFAPDTAKGDDGGVGLP